MLMASGPVSDLTSPPSCPAFRIMIVLVLLIAVLAVANADSIIRYVRISRM